MKFLITNDLRRNDYLRALLLFYFLMVLVFLGLNFGYESHRFGLTADSIRDSILGNPELFLDSMDAVALYTEIHVHLFLYSVTLLTTFSVFVHLAIPSQIKIGTVVVLSSAALLDSLSVLGTYYISPLFSWLKAVSFWSLQILFSIVVTAVLVWLLRRPYAAAS